LCLIVFGCLYRCNWLPGKTRLQNDLLCVEWDIRPYTLTQLTSTSELRKLHTISVLPPCLYWTNRQPGLILPTMSSTALDLLSGFLRTDSDTLAVFKSRLKTFVFHQTFTPELIRRIATVRQRHSSPSTCWRFINQIIIIITVSSLFGLLLACHFAMSCICDLDVLSGIF